MAKKISSTQICPVSFCLTKIAGKWKALIVFNLTQNNNRFGLLLKAMPDISKNILMRQLREMEDDLLINRTVCSKIPLRVEYELTDLGRSLLPVIESMALWGMKHKPH